MSTMPDDSQRQVNLQRLKTITNVIYVLQALSFIPPFLTYIVAVMINYIKRDDAKGTWLESHFRWQIRTFWFSLPWFLLGFLTYLFVIGWIFLVATFLWLIYRILKGWLNLYDGKPMYV